ncbi:uncharacterized protein LOC131163504 [Malania oleifera]|uniref:uncharacterized protein LOC131163504 n=1 Tax=Malania oleifera TaxID=397392 RepID=UPI0025AE5CEF|nr:uncharacterized protein LOC131163504 [Malania oleifera]
MIGKSRIGRALLDLGSSVNLLLFLIYEQLDLGELKKTTVMLQLADGSVKAPQGVVEDVLIQVDKFYYHVDFIVLDMQQLVSTIYQAFVILGRPFLATSNALIHCQSEFEEFDEKLPRSEGQIPEIDGTPHVLNASYTSSWRKPTFKAIDLPEIMKSS